MSTIAAGARARYWQILLVDPTGKRATCRCRCGEIRLVAVVDLQSGASSSCGCLLLSPVQRRAISEAKAEQQQRRNHDWRLERGR
jgi:hypothetical protein